MEKVLIIARGLPGSGKNSFSELLHGIVCCADDYFMTYGKYEWNPEYLGRAHQLCQAKCEGLMEIEFTPVIVANTSTTIKELTPYYALAYKYGYKVFSIIVENRHNGINEHGVSDEIIEKMRKRFNIQL